MMKNTITKSLSFLLLFLFLSFFVSALYSNSQKQQDHSIADVKKLPKLKTLIMGDSQCLRGIDPRVFDSAFNYASTGESIIVSYYKLKDLLETRTDIDQIVLTSTLGYFGESKSDYISKPYLWKEMIDFQEIAQIKNKHRLYLYKFLKTYFFAYKGMREEFFERHFADVPEEIPYYKGFRPKPTGYYLDVSQIADKQFKDKKLFDESLLIYLNMFLELAQKHGIQVTMVRMPVSQRYHDKVMSYITEDKLAERCLELKKKFADFVFLDYLNIYWGQEEEVLFDDTHLNEEAALSFSELVRDSFCKSGAASAFFSFCTL